MAARRAAGGRAVSQAKWTYLWHFDRMCKARKPKITTTVRNLVTCPRCLKALAGADTMARRAGLKR